MAKFSQLRKVKQPHFSLLLNKFTSLVDNPEMGGSGVLCKVTKLLSN